MKKKQPRYDRNAGSAGGTTDSDGTMSRPGGGGVAMGGGKKDAPSTNVGTTANDIHHNTSTPCCSLLAAIAGEIIIFPSTTSIISPTNADGSSNDARTTTTTAPTTTTTITLDEQSKIMQPLLGRMILNHLLNERRERLRAVDYSEGGEKEKNIMSSSIPPPSSDALDSSDIMSLRSTSSKNKKKGQKKKKRKNKGGGRINRSDETEEEEEEDNTIATVGTTTFLVPTVVVEEEEEMEEEEEEEKQPSLNYDHNIDSLLENGDMTTTTTTTEKIHHKRPVGSSTPSTTKIHDEILFNRPTTNLDTLLDVLMESTSSSSSSCHSSCGGASADTMENRNLESFTMYLKNKFEQHQQQQHDKSRGGGSNSSSSRSKTSSTSSSSSPPPATASSTTAPVVRGGMEYKDILPTVSITKANELTQYINCRKCRTSTIGALRTMTASNEFSLTLHEDNNTNNTRTTMLNHHHHHNNNSSSSSSTSRLAVPISGNSRSSVHDDIDLAFSYVNMDDDDFDLEVGHSSSSSSSILTTNGRMMSDESIFQLVLRTICSAASDEDRYLQIGCLLSSQTATSSTNTTTTTTEICDTNGNDTIDFSFPLCTDTIINLIKQLILPCGLVEAVGSTEGFGENNDQKQQQQLGNAELAAIAKEACDHVDVFQAFFANADISLLQMEEVMDRAIEKETERSVFSPIVWKLLQEGDEKCNDLSRQLATLMMNVFKLSCFVGWSAKCGGAIMAYVKRIWDMYLKRLIQLSTLTSIYHNQLLMMSNGGAIQQVYSNKVARDLLLQFIGNKVDMLKELVLDLKSNLFGDEESISSVVELCVLRAYRNHVECLGSELERIFVDQENEDMIKELITTQINLSQRTHYSPCADDLKDKTTDQRNGFINFYSRVRTRILLIEDLALKSKKDFLGIHYNVSEDIYFDISKEIERLPSSRTNGGYIDIIIDDSSLPLRQSNALIMQMLAVLTSRQRNESLMGSLDIPPRLEVWADFAVKRAKYYDTVKGDMKGTITSYFPDDSKEVLDNCDGGFEGGMRRISGIFAGLVYRWLEARCSEWHAELTRDELLESMDMEVSAVTPEGGIKGKKKKKKKTNRKTGGLNKGKNKDEQLSIPVTVSNSIPDVDNVNDAILPLPSSTPHIDSIPIDHVSSGDMSIDEESKDDEPLVKYPQFSGQDTAQLSGGKIGVNETVDDNNASAVKSNMTKNELSSVVSVAVIEGATTKCIKKKKSNRNKKKEEQAILSNVIVNSSTTANVVTPSSSSSNGHIRSFDGVPLDGFIDPKQEEYVKKLLNKFEPSSTIHQISEHNNIAKVISMDMNVPLTAFEGSVKGSKVESRSKLGGSNKDTNANNQVSIVTPLSSPTPLSNSKAFDHHDAEKIAFSVEETKEDDDSNQIPAVRRRKRDRRKKNRVVGNPENNVEVNATSNGVLKYTKFDYCKPSVGIVDGDTFISAETYLVNRLQKILDEMDYIASLKMPVII